MVGHLNEYENDRLLKNVVYPMKTKYLKYWKDIPLLYAFAFVLDPSGKLKGLTNALKILGNLTGTAYSDYFKNVRVELSNMFAKYENIFGAVP